MTQPRLALAGEEPPGPPALACLIVIVGPELGRRIDLGWGTTTIGRMESNDICLPHENISRKHAVIVRDESGVVIRDAGSTSGTYVNERRFNGALRLANGDRIQLGQTILKYLAGDDIATA